MASYQEHLAKQAARQASGMGEQGPKVHFMNEFLSQDGDTAIIRFPYRSMDDVIYTATHNVPMTGAPYGRRIRCTETVECPLCAQGFKVEERVFIKFLTYTVDENSNEVVLNCTVWDRPSAFADIDLKGLMEEYGDLSQCLFKIKRSGAGKQTRYSILPVVNAAVYNPAVYRADFTDLDKINPENILSKSMEQYHNLLNPTSASEKKPAAFNQGAQTTGVYTPTTPTQPVRSYETYTEHANAPIAPAAQPIFTPPYTAPQQSQTPVAPQPTMHQSVMPQSSVVSQPTAPVTPGIPTAPTPERQPRKYQF